MNLRNAWRLAARRDLQAALMFAMCAVWYLAAIAPERARLEQAVRHAAAQRPVAQPGTPDMAASDLARFYARFPSQDAFPDALDQLLKTAAAHALTVQQGDYTVTRSPAGKLVRFEVMLPLRGSYPQVRAFLAALARDVPGMALENAQFERRDVGEPVLDVKLRLVLFLVRAP
ncbi:MAG: hypothetical protein JWQ01_2523 [Massilia sp.]|nr:hypothetical protein [Massilia sp.]